MSKHIINSDELRLLNHKEGDTTILSTNKDNLQVNSDLIINGNIETYYTIMNINSSSWDIPFDDDTQYFSTANNLEILEDDGGHWDTDNYTVAKSGRYSINLNVSCDTYNAALAFFVEIYASDGTTLENTYRSGFEDDVFIRSYLTTTGTITEGKKIKIRAKYIAPGPGTVKIQGITGTDYRTYFSINRI